jgi:glucose/arabinose dehydrogenase
VPWEIAWLPDGRALITERPGRIRMLDGTLVAEVPVSALGEGGLMGLALDPEFESRPFVYLYFTTAAGMQLERWRFEDDRLTREASLIDGVIEAGPIHDSGRIAFGPDDALYVATGDAGNEPLAQEPDSLNGKYLRLTDPRGGASRPEIFSLGHRNPQGFDWQPETERMIENEHGQSANDEVNVLRKGANYGWPDVEGGESEEGFVSPAAYYEQTLAPSGATFVKLPGAEWTGDYLIACLAGTQIRRIGFDGDEVTTNEALFEGDFGRLRTVVEGPDRALYALTNNRDGRGSPEPGDDRILRIVPPAG